MNGTGRALLFKDADVPEGQRHDTGPGEAVIFTVRSPDKTGSNEDAAGIISLDARTAVLMVADGVGGLPAGSQASAFLVDTLEAACNKSVNEETELRDAILSGIEEANRSILESANGSATTLAAVEIREDSIRTYHVGDSIVMLVGQRGRLVTETVLHSPVGYAMEAGILSESDAIRHEDRHLVSNVVGSRSMHVSMSMPVHMKNRDTLLLATDGLIDNLDKETIINIARKGPLEEAGRALYCLAMERMTGAGGGPCKPDDLTFILYRRRKEG